MAKEPRIGQRSTATRRLRGVVIRLHPGGLHAAHI
jgi:hypothetical protein